MKESIALSFITVVLLSCARQDRPINIPRQDVRNVTVLIYDLSISTDQSAQLAASHFDTLYRIMALKGGGKFYGLFVLSNSSKQDPFTYSVPHLDTLTVKGNLFQRHQRLKVNRERLTQFDRGRNSFVSLLSTAMLLHKREKFSDLYSALQLAQQILSNPMYKNSGKQLLLISDMLNDVPPKNGIDKMLPVSISPEVKLAIVRPSDKVKIEELLPGNPFQIFVTIDDAIANLFSSLKN